MLPVGHMVNESLRFQGGIDDYPQYCAAVSALTELDMGEMKARILDLARDPDLRARMGAAAERRAREVYDWKVIIPQMQALWGEQAAMRRAAGSAAHRILAAGLPIAPSPSLLFGSYPTAALQAGQEVYHANPEAPPLEQVLGLRNYQGLNRIFAEPAQIAAVLAAVTAGAGSVAAVVEVTKLAPMLIERVVIWLLKYDFIRRGSAD